MKKKNSSLIGIAYNFTQSGGKRLYRPGAGKSKSVVQPLIKKPKESLVRALWRIYPNNDFIIFEEQKHLNKAIIGVANRDRKKVLVYDYDKIVKCVMKAEGFTEEEAVDAVDFNIEGGWLGGLTPLIVHTEIE